MSVFMRSYIVLYALTRLLGIFNFNKEITYTFLHITKYFWTFVVKYGLNTIFCYVNILETLKCLFCINFLFMISFTK